MFIDFWSIFSLLQNKKTENYSIFPRKIWFNAPLQYTRFSRRISVARWEIFTPKPADHSVPFKSSSCFILQILRSWVDDWLPLGDFRNVTSTIMWITKISYFIRKQDSRPQDRYWTKKEWPARRNQEPGSKNILQVSWVDPWKVLHLHRDIKLGSRKQLVRVLSSNGLCFQYLSTKTASSVWSKIERRRLFLTDIL